MMEVGDRVIRVAMLLIGFGLINWLIYSLFGFWVTVVSCGVGIFGLAPALWRGGPLR